MADLRGIALQIQKFVEQKKRRSSEIVDGAALEMLEYFVNNTPVDTGRGISNWQVGIGDPNNQNIDPLSEGEYGSTMDENTAEAYSIGEALIRSDREFGTPIYITNHASGEHGEYLPDFNKKGGRKYRKGRGDIPAQQRPYRQFFENGVSAGQEYIDIALGGSGSGSTGDAIDIVPF